MGYRPTTFCEDCREPFDVFADPGERVCESCLEIRAAETEQERAVFSPWFVYAPRIWS